MAFVLTIRCDEPGCDATAVVPPEAGVDGFEPVAADSWPQGAHACWDTGWISMPSGWRFTDDGERCPEHAR